jgi:molybdopterin synthase catalytic subunit
VKPPVVRLSELRDVPLSVDEVHAAVAGPDAGGVCVFVGAVRDHDGDRGVERLGYSAHPIATGTLREVAEQVARACPVSAIAVVHRVGELAVGDLAVVAAVASEHRAEAFEACRMLIDELKATVPIWKHQRFQDGSQEWVGTP